MSGLTTQFAATTPTISAIESAKAVLDRVQGIPRGPSDTAFFRGLTIAALLLVPFWAGVAWMLFRAFHPG